MKTKKERNQAKSNNKDKLIKIGIVLVTVIFIYIIYKIFNIVILSNEKIDISGNSYYQYFYGIRKEYAGEIEVVNNKDSMQLLLENNEIIYLDSTPIYYKEELGKAMLPNTMSVVYPDTGSICKVEKFTSIIQDSNVMYAKKHNKDTRKGLNNVFLYDGADLYFFLEETTVKIGKQKYVISPLSYVIVNYRQNIEIYNYDEDEYIIIEEDDVPTADVIATNKDKKYSVNMSLDTLKNKSRDQLLIKKINTLPELDY